MTPRWRLHDGRHLEWEANRAALPLVNARWRRKTAFLSADDADIRRSKETEIALIYGYEYRW